MSYEDSDFLALSGLQHFAFCPRQWALIHIEQQWQENVRTMEGRLMHERAHDDAARERRGDLLILRGLAVSSTSMGLSGQCDVVECRRCPDGVPLRGEKGLWRLYPVEYKRGKPKAHQADEIQLCAQAMCLEEMLATNIPEGALYYGEPKRRTVVPLTSELREQTRALAAQMHRLFARGHTPKAKWTKACKSCSMEEVCQPLLAKRTGAAAYVRDMLEEDAP